MDELPITLPRPKLEPDFEIESPTRVADGTKTRLGAAPRTTLPPPIPAAARRAKATVPPPIPAAALAAKPRGTTGSMKPAPADEVPVDPVIPPPSPSLEPSSKIAVAADIDVPIEHDEPAADLPPLPRPSNRWLATTAQPPPPRTDEPRRKITIAPEPARIVPQPAKPAEHDHSAARFAGDDRPAARFAGDDQTPLPPPAPESDLADGWFVDQSSRVETSAVSDLFAPSPDDAKPAKQPSKPAIAIPPAPAAKPPVSDESVLFTRPSAPDIETSAIDASRPVDLFADLSPPPAPVEEPSTNYFERTATYNKRHLAAVGAAAVCVAVLAAVIVRGALKPSAKPATPTVAATAPHAAVAAPTPPAPAPAPEPAPTPAVAPAPAPAPVEQPAPVAAAPAPAAHTIDVPITSVPSGATVTLIENGTPRVLGTTPLFASIDPAQTYDVVVALSGHPTSMQHLDPHTTSRIAVAFDGSHAAPAPAPAPAPAVQVAAAAPAAAAPAEHHHHHAEARVAAAEPAPSASPAPRHSWNVAPAARAVAGEAAAGANGVLMVASKPPCEIVIDGHPTKLETPQRSIALSPGAHAVTLINAKLHINKTVHVAVAANKSTKLIRDFTR